MLLDPLRNAIVEKLKYNYCYMQANVKIFCDLHASPIICYLQLKMYARPGLEMGCTTAKMEGHSSSDLNNLGDYFYRETT